MIIGNRPLIEAVIKGFEVNLEHRTANQLSVMHCAAQKYAGYIAMLILKKQHNFDVNPRDKY